MHFFKTLMNDIWDEAREWPGGTFRVCLFSFIFTVVTISVGSLGYVFADSFNLPRQFSTGIISKKDGKPAHMHFVAPGIFWSIPKKFLIEVQFLDRYWEIQVEKEHFSKYQIGRPVEVIYSQGRFSNQIYVNNIRIVKEEK